MTLYRITLDNSADFHVVPSGVDGPTAWSVKLQTPSLAAHANPAGNGNPLHAGQTFDCDNVENTDTFDPGSAARAITARLGTGSATTSADAVSFDGHPKNTVFAYGFASTGDDALLSTPHHSPRVPPAGGPPVPNCHDIHVDDMSIQGATSAKPQGFAANSGGFGIPAHPLVMSPTDVVTDPPDAVNPISSNARLTPSNAKLPIFASADARDGRRHGDEGARCVEGGRLQPGVCSLSLAHVPGGHGRAKNRTAATGGGPRRLFHRSPRAWSVIDRPVLPSEKSS